MSREQIIQAALAKQLHVDIDKLVRRLAESEAAHVEEKVLEAIHYERERIIALLEAKHEFWRKATTSEYAECCDFLGEKIYSDVVALIKRGTE